MEQWSESHRALQIFCSDFWPTAGDSEAILQEIDISTGRINLSEPALARWLSIIRELMRKNDGSMGRLVLVLTSQYPQNDALRTVCSPWIPAIPARANDPKAPSPIEAEGKTVESLTVSAAETKPGEGLSVAAEKKKFLSKTDLPEGTVLVEEFATEPEPQAEPASRPATKRDPLLEPAEADSGDDADLIAPRVATLWQIMVETEARLVELEFRMNAIHEAWTAVTPPKLAKPTRKQNDAG